MLYGYDSVTHREIAQRAAQPEVSSLDQVLKNELGLSEGVRQVFSGLRVERLLGEGALQEDIPDLRVLNHFHNPLVDPWDGAGLRGFRLSGQSSALWQQNPGQDTSSVTLLIPLQVGGGNWSWQNARQYYLTALTGGTKQQREAAFVNTFLALGHLTHLPQDATVPAHVRNDPHPPFLNPDGYEKWVERTRTTPQTRDLFEGFLNADPTRPPFSIFETTGPVGAPVPIARLIDTDLFAGADAGSLTRSDLGIAEYTNGNYLSRNRKFDTFTLPSQIRSTSVTLFEPDGSQVRRYFSKQGEGDSIDHFVTEGLLHNTLAAARSAPVPSGGWVLDRRVHQDYAAKLIPRAVGYSAALIDYFFRGKLDVELVPNATNPSLVDLRAINRSLEALGPGQLKLYYENAAETRQEVPGAILTVAEAVAQNATLPTLTFALPSGATKLVLAYQGTLGQEVDAVAGKVIEANSVVYTVVAPPPGVFTLVRQELAFRDCGTIAGSKLALSLGSSEFDRPAAPVDVFLFLSNQFVVTPVLIRSILSNESFQVIAPALGVTDVNSLLGTIQSELRVTRVDILSVGFRCGGGEDAYTCPLLTGEVAPPVAFDASVVATPSTLSFAPSDQATFLAATGRGFLAPSATARVLRAAQSPPPLSALKTSAEYLATAAITELCFINPPTQEEIRASSTVQDSVDNVVDFEYVITAVGSGLEAARVSVPVWR